MTILWIGIAWIVGAFIFGGLLAWILHRLKPVRYAGKTKAEWDAGKTKAEWDALREAARQLPSGVAFMCCEHDPDCERGGVPCVQWWKRHEATQKKAG